MYPQAFAISLARKGGRVEWHVVLRKSFEHLTFEHVPWFHHSIVFLLPPLSLPWFETIRSVADSMGSHSVEQLVV
jgi:hypothetical protein